MLVDILTRISFWTPRQLRHHLCFCVICTQKTLELSVLLLNIKSGLDTFMPKLNIKVQNEQNILVKYKPSYVQFKLNSYPLYFFKVGERGLFNVGIALTSRSWQKC